MNQEFDVNDPNDFKNLTPLKQEVLVQWIKSNLGRSDRYYKGESSYSLKEYFEQSPKSFYVTNGQFKGAMLAADYTVEDTKKKNWHFKLNPLSVKRLKEKLGFL